MTTPKITEAQVLRACLDYLGSVGIYAWRNNTGAAKIDGRDGSRYVRFGKVGSSDILGVLGDGRILAIECKSPSGKCSYEQYKFMAEIAKHHGVAFEARSVEDVREHLAKYVFKEEA